MLIVLNCLFNYFFSGKMYWFLFEFFLYFLFFVGGGCEKIDLVCKWLIGGGGGEGELTVWKYIIWIVIFFSD